jgi:hypothetical protein
MLAEALKAEVDETSPAAGLTHERDNCSVTAGDEFCALGGSIRTTDLEE